MQYYRIVISTLLLSQSTFKMPGKGLGFACENPKQQGKEETPGKSFVRCTYSKTSRRRTISLACRVRYCMEGERMFTIDVSAFSGGFKRVGHSECVGHSH